MNSKAKKTLARVNQNPVLTTIEWKEIASLINALGGTVIQGKGSRVRIDLNGSSINMHTPHPQKELKPYMVRAIREFLRGQ